MANKYSIHWVGCSYLGNTIILGLIAAYVWLGVSPRPNLAHLSGDHDEPPRRQRRRRLSLPHPVGSAMTAKRGHRRRGGGGVGGGDRVGAAARRPAAGSTDRFEHHAPPVSSGAGRLGSAQAEVQRRRLCCLLVLVSYRLAIYLYGSPFGANALLLEV